MKLSCRRDDLGSGLPLNVRCIDNRQFPGSKSLAGNVVENVKGIHSRNLAVFIVANPTSARIGGKNFRCLKMFSRKCAFAGTAGPN